MSRGRSAGTGLSLPSCKSLNYRVGWLSPEYPPNDNRPRATATDWDVARGAHPIWLDTLRRMVSWHLATTGIDSSEYASFLGSTGSWSQDPSHWQLTDVVGRDTGPFSPSPPNDTLDGKLLLESNEVTDPLPGPYPRPSFFFSKATTIRWTPSPVTNL